MTRDWRQTDPTYVIDDPPKGFECPPFLNFVGQMTRDNGLVLQWLMRKVKVVLLLLCYWLCLTRCHLISQSPCHPALCHWSRCCTHTNRFLCSWSVSGVSEILNTGHSAVSSVLDIIRIRFRQTCKRCLTTTTK